MALSFVGSAEGSSANGGDVTLTHPGTIAEDDVVYVGHGVATGIGDYDVSVSTGGYTELADIFETDGLNANLGIFRKIMPVTPDSTVVCVGTGGSGDSTAAVEHVWRGADQTTPEDATTTTATGVDVTNPDSPAIVTATANAIVLTIGAGTINDASVTMPTGYSNQVDANGNDNSDVTVGMASKSVSSPGTENPAAWTGFTDPGALCCWAAGTVAIRPAGGAVVVGPGRYPRLFHPGRGVSDQARFFKSARSTQAQALGVFFLNADPGSYSITGIAANLIADHLLGANPGTYVITGIAADLLAGRILSADIGSYSLSGIAASLIADRLLNADPGVYTLTGIAADILADRIISADPGVYVVSGVEASVIFVKLYGARQPRLLHPGRGVSGLGRFFKSPRSVEIPSAFGAFILIAEPGSYSITGVDTNLLADRLLNADLGSYSITGALADLLAGRMLNAEPGSYTVVGVLADLLAGRVLSADPGSYGISGVDAILSLGRFISADPGIYSISGVDTTLLAAHLLNADPGTYTIDGIAAALIFSGAPVAEVSDWVVRQRRRRH